MPIFHSFFFFFFFFGLNTGADPGPASSHFQKGIQLNETICRKPIIQLNHMACRIEAKMQTKEIGNISKEQEKKKRIAIRMNTRNKVK